MSVAKINIWNQTVGYLYWDDPNQTAIFEADDSYIESPLNVAPIIHRDKTQRLSGRDFHEKFSGLIPTFNDSLPDAFGNIIFKEWLEQNKIDQSELNPVERLLYVGKRGVGALEYEVGKEISHVVKNIDLLELAKVSDKIIKRKYDQSDYLHAPEALRNILTIGSSVGGAQAKVLIAITDYERLLAGDILHRDKVDYYIVKIEHDQESVWNKEKNFVEFTYNEMARDAGIRVAESKLIHHSGQTHFASQRFDRVDNQKIHQQTVNALSGFYGRNTQFSYSDIFGIIDFLKLPYANIEQLFRQMTFNVAAFNRDDHTKNFSFLMTSEGKWSLSPAYDLTFPFDPYQNFFMPHQISINNKTREITRKDLIAVAELAGVRNYQPMIEEVIEHVSTFEQRIRQYNVNPKTVHLISKELNRNINLLR